MLGMTKAKINVLDGKNNLTFATLASVTGAGTVHCIFNPSDFTIERSINYAQHKIPGNDRPILQFISGEAEVMRFSLLFDTYSAGVFTTIDPVAKSTVAPDAGKMDVRHFTDPLMKLTTINSDTHAPSCVQFVWGSISFKGYVQSISQRFTMFNMFGKPVRATVEISLISCEENKNVVKNSPDRTKARTVSEGDRIYAFAYDEYGDCAEWRRIAEKNGIDNPRTLEAGMNIVIPPIL